jgi:hypothetical protein
MEKVTIKMDVDRKSLRDLYAVFKTLDEDTNARLKIEVHKLADYVAREVRNSGYMSPKMPAQAKLVADTVRANKDRIPGITIGGSKTANVSRKATPGSPKPRVGQLLYGSEFGVKTRYQMARIRAMKAGTSMVHETGTTRGNGRGQFKQGGYKFPIWSGPARGARRGSAGWWIYPTLKELQPTITHRYHAIIDKAIARDWAD